MSDYIVRMPTGAYAAWQGGDLVPTRDLRTATRYTIDRASDIADAIGGGVALVVGDEVETVDIGTDGTPRRARMVGRTTPDPTPDVAHDANAVGYPKRYAPDLDIDKPAIRRAKKAAAVEKEVFGTAIHGEPETGSLELISAEVQS